MADSGRRLHASIGGNSIIFSTCDLLMNALTGSVRGQIGAPRLLSRFARVVCDNAAARRFEEAARA
ncbi:hypothetical protein R69927_04821 [Paraburkholderia domus]|uniref:Uncharacterized protein n=1 Tax=Paraburkholderia domus TaxID=2793075 RepID=A0A9N8N2X1_9BURK|nr:hypothetical protein R70006_01417 [Paraburkholderia domus]CAE6759106.1 hypothetical protein R75483_03477 [Paraburkholderia domus]CAE6832810.1 hypothetical protein R69749_04085 [Paraburkholderia domus]CAE6867465.1 hypothetical protein R70199_01326 [Paraburkholderia domus]CAE6876042.1 hypothetical protein R75471_01414 [Paraburkholderia domus]